MPSPFRLASRNTLMALAAIAAGVAFAGPASAADPGKIVVQVDQPGAIIKPEFYGLMTEEINYSYDGGLYGELLRNRIFRDPVQGGGGRGAGANGTLPPAAIPHWSAVNTGNAKATLAVDTSNPVNTTALTTALKLSLDGASANAPAGAANDGYWGIPVKPNTTYTASFYARGQGISGPLNVAIGSVDGQTTYASATVPALTGEWKRYTVKLTTGPNVQPSSGFTVLPPLPERLASYQQALQAYQTAQAAAATQPPPTQPAGRGRGRGGTPQPPGPSGRVDTRFTITASSPGTVWLNLVSLMPPTYKDRPNGNRIDVSQLLADMKPTFLRFPGGNYVEGNDLPNRWNWKATIGPLEERAGHMSPWGYRSTDGMGLLEFMGWCEDLNMEPVVAVFAGYVLGGRGANFTGPELQPYVQEALDEIEYLTGDATTEWGARRAKDGHPAPFKVRYVEIGNEDPGGANSTYSQRFPPFYKAIKAKYPQIQIISTVRSGFGDVTPDVIDEHYYMNFNGALTNAHMYDPDRRPRTDAMPKIFVGEWATRDNNPTPSFHSALTDAAFLTGLERNADLIVMSCYAPLFVNVNPGYPQYPGGPDYNNGQQWATDLIGYNSLTSFGSPSYYVQKMFYSNKGDVALPISLAPQIAPPPASAPATTPAPGGRGGRGGPATPPLTIFASSSRDEATGDVIVKVVNAAEAPQQMEINLQGAPAIGKTARIEVLSGALTDVNTLAEPTKVAPRSATIDASAKFVHEFPANSVTVMRFSTK